ncbi:MULTISPECIES: CRISPR system precrRNA processing endoribonuclease RAMP protein Cas6 [unclassified Streptomyces]|uniref:CRISPR system precrRNA processing endoribonuclease RAMP protein Cas6 n=1 Tax=unclassified Streptomyces TaxID=2593676 RepID=UPI002253C0C1|nr:MULTISPECIES: CRISPR system precrRNA processing endoribonuclease RAMP protein Cas6 [unclassified Streptomyces]MCX5054665.1 CRISPR system precrRNA processing endoribonuclease RAMP protein Cas6 [Streptomyces sp. NBC_00474]
MPSRWQLLLRPTNPTRTKHVPPAQLHGLACHLLEGAAADHHAQTKPFSITPLIEAPHAPGNATLALSWLNDLTTPPLDVLKGAEVRLGSQFFTVDDVQPSHAPYTALEALPPTRRATLNFLSVTYFNRSGRWIPLPDPELLYGSLARRWNTFTPNPLPDALITGLISTVRLTAHELSSAPADLGQASRTGFTGQATFTLPHSAPDELAVVFTALSAYAEAAGTGAQTTHGLGWTTTTLHPPSIPSHHPITIPSTAPVPRHPTQRTQSPQGT